jgi:hypothetical protein
LCALWVKPLGLEGFTNIAKLFFVYFVPFFFMRFDVKPLGLEGFTNIAKLFFVYFVPFFFVRFVVKPFLIPFDLTKKPTTVSQSRLIVFLFLLYNKKHKKKSIINQLPYFILITKTKLKIR